MIASNSIIFILATILLCNLVNASDVSKCEVCQKVTNKVLSSLQEKNEELNQKNIEKGFVSYCKNTQIEIEKRLCYYIGAAEDAATRILPMMSKPLSYSKPVDKVCAEMDKIDDQICRLRYEVEIDISNVNLKSLRVRELRKILSSWNERCDGCIEKEEFIQKIEELKPKYVKTEL